MRLLLAIAMLANLWTATASGQQREEHMNLKGADFDITLPQDLSTPNRGQLLDWISNAADAVATYYGKFPVPRVTLRVRSATRAGIHHGVTYPTNGGLIMISVGEGTTPEQLHDDWTLTHEMIHLAFPSMSEEHHWIEEGLSTYVEPIARAQTGNMSVEEVWRQFVSDMPQGQPEEGDAGLDHTHTWGRTYWGGALFCLIADVRIREATHNRKGLEDALRAIVAAGGTIASDWEIESALKIGDQATGTTALEDLYRQTASRPAPADLDALWKKLGVRLKDGRVSFDDHAPEANIRKAITAKLGERAASATTR